MSDRIKRELEQALKEPSVPEELVTRTIRRCQLETAGRRAEEMLAAKGNSIPVQQRRELAADSILGRLAVQNDVPAALNTQRLVQDERFCRLADRPAEQLLQGLQKGTIFKEIRSAAKQTPARQQTVQPVRQGAEAAQDPPVKKGRSRTGPVR